MPFLPPNQQRQITEGTIRIRCESEIRQTLDLPKIVGIQQQLDMDSNGSCNERATRNTESDMDNQEHKWATFRKSRHQEQSAGYPLYVMQK